MSPGAKKVFPLVDEVKPGRGCTLFACGWKLARLRTDSTAGAIAAGIGYSWGHGELTYQGVKHKFKISGVSIVDVGVANISADGLVYHLSNLEDLNGNYVAASAGLTIAGGGDAVVLRNEHGVFIKLLGTTQGLRFDLAGSGITVKLES